MSSTAVKKITIALFATAAGLTAHAAELPFRILQDPVLGLRYDVRTTKFEPMPQAIFSLCRSLLVSANVTGNYWIYGKANEAARTYYVIGGYSEDLHPAPGYRKYQKDELGAVVYVQGQDCRAIDPAREVFEDRDFNEIPQSVLQRLADDVVARLANALGGVTQLRNELRNQRIDQEQLSEELRSALATLAAKP